MKVAFDGKVTVELQLHEAARVRDWLCAFTQVDRSGDAKLKMVLELTDRLDALLRFEPPKEG